MKTSTGRLALVHLSERWWELGDVTALSERQLAKMRSHLPDFAELVLQLSEAVQKCEAEKSYAAAEAVCMLSRQSFAEFMARFARYSKPPSAAFVNGFRKTMAAAAKSVAMVVQRLRGVGNQVHLRRLVHYQENISFRQQCLLAWSSRGSAKVFAMIEDRRRHIADNRFRKMDAA